MSYPPPTGRSLYGYDLYDQRSGRYYRIDDSGNNYEYEDGEVVPRTAWNQSAVAGSEHYRTASHSRESGYEVSGAFASQSRSHALTYAPAQSSPASRGGRYASTAYPVSGQSAPSQADQAQQSLTSYSAALPSPLGHPPPSLYSPRPNPASLSVYADQDALATQLRNASLNEQRPPQPAWPDQERTPRPSYARPAQQSETPQTHPAITTHTSVVNGVNMVYAHNRLNNVQTVMGTYPPEAITDPVLYRNDIAAHRALYGTQGQSETLFPNFELRPSSFFRLGRVFMTLWSEPAGTRSFVTDEVPGFRAPSAQSGISRGPYGEPVFSKVRRFVVIRESNMFCTALPINSYGRQGVGKKNVIKSDHAIIFTGHTAPQPLASERPARGEAPMRPNAIRVVPDGPQFRLHDASRLDYGKTHTVHHNLKVSPMGMVHEDSLVELSTQFQNVWGVRPNVSAAGAARPPAAGRRHSRPTASGSSGSRSAAPQPSQQTTALRAGRQGAPQPQNAARQQRAEDAALLQAQQARYYFQSLVDQGRSRREAFALMVQRLMSTENCDRERAADLVSYRLSYGRPSGGRNADDERGNDDYEDEEGGEENIESVDFRR